MQATKIRRTIADIEVLQNAKLTSESRLSNIQEVSIRMFIHIWIENRINHLSQLEKQFSFRMETAIEIF